MAASLLLERKLNELENRTPANENHENNTKEMEHNARIRSIYDRLTDPTISADELMGREKKDDSDIQKFNRSEYYKANPREALFGDRANLNPVNASVATPNYQPMQTIQNIQPAQSVQQMQPAQPYFVTNARADADIFRADSPVNQRLFPEQPVAQNMPVNEEESEDLRPTQTTIQYGAAESVSNEAIPSSTVKNVERNEARSSLGKREKIVIGTFISMVVALFVLVIINSAIISKLNSDVSSAEESLAGIKSEYAQIEESIEEAKSDESIYEYIQQNGMVYSGE